MEYARSAGKMKRICSVFIALVLAFTVTGCGLDRDKKSDKVSIVTTMFAAYDFAREIAGDRADITLLLKPGADSHSYEPSPKDMAAIDNCDIFIYTGGENDDWVDRIAASSSNKDMKIIKMLDLVDKYEEEITEGMEHHEGHNHDEDHDHDEDTSEWDEHVWTDPENAMIISKKIADTLALADYRGKDYYMGNYKKYEKELKDLDEEFRILIDNAKRKEVIFGDRFPLRYFVEAYGLTYYAAFPGCTSESEPSAKTVAFLIDKVKTDNIPVIFTIELSNGNIAKTIAKNTGTKVLTFYTCHNISKDDFEKGETYVSLMRRNLVTLKEALY